MRKDADRIVITGLGILCALGDTPESVYQSMMQAKSGIKKVKRFDVDSLLSSIAGEIDEVHLASLLTDKSLQSLDDCAKYGVFAAKQALQESGLSIRSPYLADDDSHLESSILSNRIGLAFGTCNAGILSLEKQWDMDKLDIEHTAKYPFYEQGDDIAKVLGLSGPVTTMNTACSASGNAIGYAVDLIRWGHADVMVAGGADPLSLSVYAGFNVLRALNPKAVSPFASGLGLNLGEGAAFVVLEKLDHARSRGAYIYGEVSGYGLSNDAYHETAPHPQGEGMARAVEMALKDGGLSPVQVDYINAHGTGTPANDQAEIAALKNVFGEDMRVPVSSSKAYFGHNLGAAAAVELVTTLYAINKGYLPGTLHFDSPRPGCEHTNIIDENMRRDQPAYILSNNAAFGGHNVSLLIKTDLEKEITEQKINKFMHDGNARVGEDDANNRVVITGIGAIGPWGITEGFILQDKIPPAISTENAKPVTFSLKEYEKAKYERRMNQVTQYTIGAALVAMRHDGEALGERSDIGFIFGTARGSTEGIRRYLSSVFEKGPEFASSIYFPHTVINSVAGKVSKKLQLEGFSSSFSTGGNEGMTAALYAKGKIKEGKLSTCLIGAGDERSSLSDAIDAAKGLSESRYVQSTGSVCLMVTNLNSALKENKNIIAELKAFSTIFTANLSEKVKKKAIRKAIEEVQNRCGMNVSDIDLVLLNSIGRENELEWERNILGEALGADNVNIPIYCLNDRFGYGESYSSLLHLAVAAELISSQKSRETFMQSYRLRKETISHVLVISSSVNGNYTIAIVGKVL